MTPSDTDVPKRFLTPREWARVLVTTSENRASLLNAIAPKWHRKSDKDQYVVANAPAATVAATVPLDDPYPLSSVMDFLCCQRLTRDAVEAVPMPVPIGEACALHALIEVRRDEVVVHRFMERFSSMLVCSTVQCFPSMDESMLKELTDSVARSVRRHDSKLVGDTEHSHNCPWRCELRLSARTMWEKTVTRMSGCLHEPWSPKDLILIEGAFVTGWGKAEGGVFRLLGDIMEAKGRGS